MTEAKTSKRWTPTKVGVLLLAALLLADYLYTAWTWIGWNSRSALGQDPFLAYALALREGGALPFGNDHPLYPAILSLWVRRDPASFTWSKLFSMACGLFTVVATWRIGRSMFGAAAGLLAAAWLSANWILLSLSASLRAEVLLPPLFLLAWYATWKGFAEEKERWWFAAGAFGGLAYLAKGTGLLFVAAWAAAWAAASLREPRLWRRGLWYLAGFAPPAAGLWWANRELFGDAARNFSIQHAMWLESWWELPGKDWKELTFASYLQEHGWGGLLRREAEGIRVFAPLFAACLSPAESFPVLRLLRWPALAAVLGALWRTRGAVGAALRERGEARFTAALFGLFFLLFAWYHQVSPSERFVGPLAPVALLLLAAAMVKAAEPAFVRLRSAGRPALAAGVLLLGANLGLKAAEWGWASPFETDRPLDCYRRAMGWLEERKGPALYGPSADLPRWLLASTDGIVEAPERGAPRLVDWLEERNAERAVVDWDMARLPIFADHFEPVGERGVRLKALLPGWRLAAVDGHEPPHLLLLEKEPASTGTGRPGSAGGRGSRAPRSSGKGRRG